VLRLSKQARHCGYGQAELEFAGKDQLLEKIFSLELRTKLFEESNYSLLRQAIDRQEHGKRYSVRRAVLETLRSDNGDGNGNRNVRSLGRVGPRRVGVLAKIEITN